MVTKEKVQKNLGEKTRPESESMKLSTEERILVLWS